MFCCLDMEGLEDVCFKKRNQRNVLKIEYVLKKETNERILVYKQVEAL